jgi:hypothetical protein
LASAGVTAAKAKIIAEHLIIARIFAPKLEGRFEPQSTKLAMMTSESIPFERSRSTGPIAQNRCHRAGDCTQHGQARAVISKGGSESRIEVLRVWAQRTIPKPIHSQPLLLLCLFELMRVIAVGSDGCAIAGCGSSGMRLQR